MFNKNVICPLFCMFNCIYLLFLFCYFSSYLLFLVTQLNPHTYWLHWLWGEQTSWLASPFALSAALVYNSLTMLFFFAWYLIKFWFWCQKIGSTTIHGQLTGHIPHVSKFVYIFFSILLLNSFVLKSKFYWELTGA